MKFRRWASLFLVASVGLFAQRAEAFQVAPVFDLVDQITPAAAPESSCYLTEVCALGQTDFGEQVELAVFADSKTLIRVFCIVQSPLGLEYMPSVSYGSDGRMAGVTMVYVAPVGKPGTGHSLGCFNRFKRLGMIEGDAFDVRFENVLSGASAQYPFGNLSEAEVMEAIDRGYVGSWDYPLLGYHEPSGDWAVMISGGDAVKEVLTEVSTLGLLKGYGAFRPSVGASKCLLPTVDNVVYRELSAADRAARNAGKPIQPKGTGGTVLDHVRGKPTGHISASETIEGTARFRGGNGLAEIQVDRAGIVPRQKSEFLKIPRGKRWGFSAESNI
ncbi:MAG: hypothetical protein ACI9X0_002099 [Kiritimatiellia bacterium]|jgi:hypothetical protein